MNGLFAALLAATALAVTGAAHAGSLWDPTFGSHGEAVLPAPLVDPDNSARVYMRQLSDGRLAVLYGTVYMEGSHRAGTTWYLSVLRNDGTIDAAFGSGGPVEVGRTALPSLSFEGLGVYEDSGGRIVVWGWDNLRPGTFDFDNVLKRFLPDGGRDSSFGSNGTVTLPPMPRSGQAGDINDVQLVSYRDAGNGRKIVLSRRMITGLFGGAGPAVGYLVLLNDAGMTDSSFNGTGLLAVDFFPGAATIGADGSFVVTGTRYDKSPAGFVTAVYEPNGTRRNLSLTPFALGSTTLVSTQDDGSYVANGLTGWEVRDRFGALDRSIGNDGILQDPRIFGMAKTPDGGFVGRQDTRICAWRASGGLEACDDMTSLWSSGGAHLSIDGSYYVANNTPGYGVEIVRYTAVAPNVEYFNSILGHYFITYDGSEARAVDAGRAGPGWSRTGLGFKAGGTTPVCRFYGTPGIGSNSHFFTISAQECALVKKDPGWTFEGYGFYATPAVDGQCAAPLVPVHRLYNNRAAQRDSNHRHVTDMSLIPPMVRAGWSYEGVAFCVRP